MQTQTNLARPPRATAAHRLERETFRTSRLAEFCSQREPVAQSGHEVEEWPVLILKEGIDNALDACEEAGTAPAVAVSVSTQTGWIDIVDDGPGIPPDTVAGILDYNVRASSREAYCSPTRGAQGNALMVLLAMGYALTGERGESIIEAQGAAHRITLSVDRLRQEPRIAHDIATSRVKTGTTLRLRWPELASSVLTEAKARFLQIAGAFRWLNPHLGVSLHWDGRRLLLAMPTDPTWRKWAPSDPTSAH